MLGVNHNGAKAWEYVESLSLGRRFKISYDSKGIVFNAVDILGRKNLDKQELALLKQEIEERGN